MNGKWNATKSIILQVERNHRASFYCQKMLVLKTISLFFLNQIEDICEIISTKYEYPHREAVSRQT